MGSAFWDTEFHLVNPLDTAEQVVHNRQWVFDRSMDDELVAEFTGQWCNLRIWLTWQQDLRALMLSCSYESRIPARMKHAIYPLLALINERLWLGHFDLSSEDH